MSNVVNDTVIKVKNLTKSYKLYYKPQDRFRETFHPFRKKYHGEFSALNDISFEVKSGETVGIVGKNGSGKSTLLQILYGVLTPSSGTVEVKGKVSALLELGSCFNPQLTGIENIYFNGTLMGYSEKEMDERLDDILAFADIGHFAYQPMKIYSSGMFVRVAFSVATMVDPDILLIDEALSVGDIFFQAKCMDRMKKMIDEENVTLIFVSHNLPSVKNICKRAILLDDGVLLADGKSSEVSEKYYSFKVKSEQKVIETGESAALTSTQKDEQISAETRNKIFTDNSLFLQKAAYQRIQNGKATIVNFLLLDEHQDLIFYVSYEQILLLRAAVEIHEDMHTLIHGYQIRNEDGVELIHSDTETENKNLLNVKKGDRYILDWRFKVSLTNYPKNYTIATSLFRPLNLETSQIEMVDYVPIAAQFQMQPKQIFPLCGLVHWYNEVDIIKM
ncbi:ABC transporter ATP-binding protein [candidate division CSSED10-310 bacterium]|uniref:ABC transporter ATP-binding protein n=1 Tax=candidate division CSSED10-310 bacterium TaxID=2855610 RepID=A0ABV6YQT1_UNCC1